MDGRLGSLMTCEPPTCHKLIKVQKKSKNERKDKDEMEDSQEKDEEFKER